MELDYPHSEILIQATGLTSREVKKPMSMSSYLYLLNVQCS